MLPETRAHVGPGAFDRLPELLAGVRSIALVSGQASFSRCGAEQRLGRLLPPGTVLRRFGEFQRNPAVEDVERGIAWLRAGPADLLLAVGGGSVIDMAKAINTLSTLDAAPREALLDGITPRRGALPLVAVPTTAGTGSEATRFAALYVDGIKYSLDHPCLLPAAALVDPSLASSSSPQLTACAGLDALCQAIESYWAVRATQTSRAYAAQAIRDLLPHLRRAAAGGADDAFVHLSRGAWHAGRAIDISRTTAAHALSYPLTTRAGIPHGHAVAMTLPYFMEKNESGAAAGVVQGDLRSEDVRAVLKQLWALLGCSDGSAAAARLESLVTDLGLSKKLGHARGDGALIERMAQEINPDRLGNNPVPISDGEVREAYERLR